MDEFTKRIRELRRQKNLSQTELGKVANIHRSNIARYEKGLSKPSADKLKLLAEVLGVTTDYLMGENTKEAAKAKIEDKDLLEMVKEIEKLPEDEKIVVKKFLDAFLSKKKIHELTKPF